MLLAVWPPQRHSRRPPVPHRRPRETAEQAGVGVLLIESDSSERLQRLLSALERLRPANARGTAPGESHGYRTEAIVDEQGQPRLFAVLG